MKSSFSTKDIWILFLNGGKATRMHPYTTSTSKALVPLINNFPLAEIILYNLAKILKTKRVIFSAKGLNNYKDLQGFFQGGSGWSAKHHISPQVNFEYQHPNYQDTGSADSAKYNVNKYNIKTPILVIAADGLHCPQDILNMIKFSSTTKASFVMGLNRTNNPADYGIATKISKSGIIKQFIEKPKDKNLKIGLANNGVYFIKPQAFPALHDDFGKNTIPTLINQGQVAGFKFHNPWLDFGNPKLHLQNSLKLIRSNPDYLFKFIKSSHNQITSKLYIRGKSKIAIKNTKQIVADIKAKKITIKGSVIIGKECLIGQNVTLQDCSIGDYCKIGDNCTIKQSNIMDGWDIENNVSISNSLLGRVGSISHHSNIESSFLGHNVQIKHHAKLKNKILKS